MKAILFTLSTVLAINSFSQSESAIDSIINVICKTINKSPSSLPDTTRVLNAFDEHLYPFVKGLPDSAAEKTFLLIYTRLQLKCKEFGIILNRLQPPKGDWKDVPELPKSKLVKKDCTDFLDKRYFTYIEGNGDTTNLEISTDYWIDRFKDGTYSKLSFKWTGPCEFEISFIESNNLIRSRMSRPGDKYFYRIIDRRANYYDIGVRIPGGSRALVLKLYFK